MSLQRIIELARRQGMPVILTDVAGREPMVVLPLEAYEAMLDDQDRGSGVQSQKVGQIRDTESSVSQKPHEPRNPSSTRDRSQVRTEPSDGLRVRQRDEDRVQTLHRSLDTVSQEVPAQPLPQKEGADGLVMEERFSFQP